MEKHNDRILCRWNAASEHLFVTGIITTALDLIICLLNLMFSMEQPENPVFAIYAYLVCHLITSDALTFGVVAIRMNANMLTAMFYFIQLVYPFMRIEQRSRSTMIIFSLITVACLTLEVIPNFFSTQYLFSTGVCLMQPTSKFYVTPRFEVLLRLMILFNFLYNFILPISASIFLYRHVFRILRMREKSRTTGVYREMKQCFIQDVCLVIVFSAAAEFGRFILKYPPNERLVATARTVRMINFTLFSYSIIHPLLAIAFRKRYQRPILECLIYMGLNPTEYWLTRKLRGSEVADTERTGQNKRQ